jgi:hypothetical protein
MTWCVLEWMEPPTAAQRRQSLEACMMVVGASAIASLVSGSPAGLGPCQQQVH